MKEKDFEKILKALANKRRLAVIKYLKKHKEATVGELAEAINLSFRSTSKHLGVLSVADIVEKEQRSLEVYYKIPKILPRITRSIINLI